MNSSPAAARTAPHKPLILIPARMQAARLPGKPLADINGLPMIIHVLRRALESGLGPVAVAAGDAEIVEAVKKHGGQAVLTDPALATGSDRIYAALQQLDTKGEFDSVINVQGDEPLQDPADIRAAFALLKNPAVDIATCVKPITDPARINAPQVVKAALEYNEATKSGRALYFSRTPIPNGGPYFQHIGLYAYRRDALEVFVKHPNGYLQLRESLEQLRALAIGLRIDAAVVESTAIGVDTPEDLEMVRKILKEKK